MLKTVQTLKHHKRKVVDIRVSAPGHVVGLVKEVELLAVGGIVEYKRSLYMINAKI